MWRLCGCLDNEQLIVGNCVKIVATFFVGGKAAVDELRMALELATEEELLALSNILFRPKFNPLDYLCAPSPQQVQSSSRSQQLDLLESRFRFLAADGFAVLNRRDQAISYRQILLQVCRYLKVRVHSGLATEDLESELFLHLMERYWDRLGSDEQALIQRRVGDALADVPDFEALTPTLKGDAVRILLKGGSALTLTSVLQPLMLKQIARQFALQAARYELAKQTLAKGGVSAVLYLQSRATLHMASRGMAVSAARYGATRAMLTFAGPLLWGWFLADLGWRAVATNYSRVIPALFTLVQIRLIRSVELVCS